MDNNITRLDRLLSRVQLLDPPYRESDEGKQLFQEICELALEEKVYRHVRSEPILNQLDQLFQTEKPDEELFGTEIEEIRTRATEVREINDFFFGILDISTTVHDLCQSLSKIHRITEEFRFSVAESILVIEPKDPVIKWRIVHWVLKIAKLHKQWNLISRWIERIKPDELSTIPMKDDRGHDGWCDQAIWFNFRIRSGIEVGNKEEAILIAQRASNIFHQQRKFFKRLEALANFRLGRLVEAEGLYNNLDGAGRADWWILHEHAQVLRELGNLPKALTLMCKAALSNKKLVSLVSLFSDIGFLCQEMELKGDARNHLVLCKYIREEQGWSIPGTINSVVVNLDNELADVYSPVDVKGALAACRKFWLGTAGEQEVYRGPSLRDRGIRRLLKGTVKLGPSERHFAFILSDNRDSYFCFKSDLPDGLPDGASLHFDAVPSFDIKKNRESWKAVNIRPA